jgi:transcription elongation factor Elf1
MPYTNDTLLAVTCTECGHRWQMTYGELQRYTMVYKSLDDEADRVRYKEYFVTCPQSRCGESFIIRLPVREQDNES